MSNLARVPSTHRRDARSVPVRPSTHPVDRSRAAGAERPPLRVVPARRPFAGAAAVVLIVVFLAMLGLTTFQTRMAQQQVRIDQLEEAVDAAKRRSEILVRRRAELRSPQRLGLESERLGMVQAEAAGFVTVDASVYTEVMAASGRLAEDSDADVAGAGG